VIVFSQFDRITKNGSDEVAFSFPEDLPPDSLVVIADAISIDHVNGALTLRLEFEPSNLLMGENNLLAQDIVLDVYGATGESEYLF